MNGKNLRSNIQAGFLVFLIALPLSLGISLACGYPAIAGVFTAIMGGVLGTLLSPAQLTIKGPAAGLIVVAIGCVTDFGFTLGRDHVADFEAYRLALGVGVAAAVIQILFALFRAGSLGDFFPLSAVHGMLAAIGIIIVAKQAPILLGTTAKGEPLSLLIQIPQMIGNMNPEVAMIGVLCLAILFLLPLLSLSLFKFIPVQMLVILVAIPLGSYFDLATQHTYSFHGHLYELGEQFLVSVPHHLISAITLPNFSGLTQWIAWKWVLMFSIIGSLETLLSAKAVDLLDPQRRKTDFNRDLLAVGICNLVASFIGGLPMISEIVRSRANIDNGAQTKWANLFHGVFLLLFVSSVPALIHRIPLSALAAMLIYTGYRLASPREFVAVFKIGPEQLAIFCTTIVVTLATDLLAGVGAGVGLSFVLHLYHGANLRSLFSSKTSQTFLESKAVLEIEGSIVFSNWLLLKRKLVELSDSYQRIVIDFTETLLVDHNAMEHLHHLKEEFELRGCSLETVGMEGLHRFSSHPHAAGRRLKNIGQVL